MRKTPAPRADVEAAAASLSRSDPNEARHRIQRLYKTYPDDPICHDLHGLLARRDNNMHQAIKSFREALDINPNFFSSIANLASSYTEVGNHFEAIDWYKRALELRKDVLNIYTGLANALSSTGFVEEARVEYENALKIAPNDPVAIMGLGSLELYKGDTEGAAKYYEEVIEKHPRYSPGHRNLSLVIKYKPDTPHLSKLEQLVSRRDVAEQDQIQLHFALGKAYADIKEYDRAFASFELANDLLYKSNRYDAQREISLISRLKSGFGSMPSPVRPRQPAAVRPVFIIAPPRSGTSLVEQILSTNNTLFGGGEMPHIPRMIYETSAQVRPPDLGMFTRIREGYLEAIQGLAGDKTVVTDKQTDNHLWIGHIATAMPDARILYIRRDKRAVGWSVYRRIFNSPELGWSYNMREIGSYLRRYEDLIQFWQRRLPDRVHIVDYEELVADPENRARDLVEAAGFEWDDSYLKFYELERAVQTASALQVRSPIYRGSSEEWRNYEKHLGPMLEALEDPQDQPASKPPTTMFRA